MAQHCVHSGLDLFETPVLQTSITSGDYVEYRPLAALEASTPVEFAISGGGEYLDLANSYLRVRAQIVMPDGSKVPAGRNVVPMNLTLHSLFSDVAVYLNTVQVSTPSGCYPYQAYLQTLLSYSPATKESQLEAAMWYADSGGHLEDVTGTDNVGMVKRKGRAAQSQTLDMMGRLHSDLFHQGKYLINHLDMRIKLTRSKDAFVLSADEATPGERPEYKIKLLDAALHVRKVAVSPVIALAHAKTLEKANAVYPLTKTVMRVFTVAQGSFSMTADNLFLDRIPNRVVLGFVRADAFNGSYDKNPFNFEHVNVNFLSLYHDGRQIPNKGLRPDFANGQYTRSFMSLFNGGGGSAWSDVTCGITLAEYARGYTLYFFDLTPSLTHSHAATEVQAPGPLRLECQFAEGLAQPMNLIIYAEVDGRLEITHTREVLVL